MNASRQWLEAFLRQRLDARDIASRLAMRGAPVDAVEPLGADLGAFVVGLVTTVRPHPDADKLRVTTVDDGSGTIFNVVCGAPNVTAGNRYPFARLGTVMPGGLKIERRKLRGEASEGMLCSARELGLGQDHDGLLTLDTDAAPGTPLTQVLDTSDERMVIDVTPNRPDLLGHKGIARELAASLGVPFRLPAIPGESPIDLPTPARFGDEAPVGGIRVAIDDREGCGRLLTAVLRNVAVAPSPEWLRQRLAAVGVRSINNVVDATNYVMFELNQPMHAYDAATLRGPALIVRTARDGETITTLDGKERLAPAGALVIADAERAIGFAGIMGGAETEVRDTTTSILLECAWFDPARIRRTARALGLSTDASHRFERGTDRWGAVDALRRCIRLIVTLAGGELDGVTTDCFPEPVNPPRLFLRTARVAQVLGVALSLTDIEKQLVAIGCTVVSKPDDGRIAVDVPGWRPDITAEIDLIEEVARSYGYDRFPDDLRAFRPGNRRDDPAWDTAARVRTALQSQGMSEVITLPMVAAGGVAAPPLRNPLSAEHGFLRHALAPALVREVEANWAVATPDARLFEIGTVFNGSSAGTPVEALHGAFAVTGRRAPAHWTDAGANLTFDRWDALALFELLRDLADPSAEIRGDGDGWVAVDLANRHLGRCGPALADAPAWAAPVFVGEMALSAAERPGAQYRPLATFPAVTRDLALVMPVDRAIDSVTRLLHDRGRRHGLESVGVVEEYRGTGIPDGKRVVTVRLVFRAPDRTLKDTEVDPALGRLISSLERELDITLRSS